MPVSTIAGTRIKFLRSLSIGLRAKDSGADPDLKQKMICYYFDVDAYRLPGIEIVPPAFEGTLDRVRRILGSRQAVAIRQSGHTQACCCHDPAACSRCAVASSRHRSRDHTPFVIRHDVVSGHASVIVGLSA
jgi:hypothetical protein